MAGTFIVARGACLLHRHPGLPFGREIVSVSNSPAVAAAHTETRAHGSHFVLVRQLAVVTEMLDAMDTLTVAGQRHTMSKVVGFVENQVAHAGTLLGRRHQHMLAELLRQLTAECQRLCPNVPSFTERAQSLVALLSTIA